MNQFNSEILDKTDIQKIRDALCIEAEAQTLQAWLNYVGCHAANDAIRNECMRLMERPILKD